MVLDLRIVVRQLMCFTQELHETLEEKYQVDMIVLDFLKHDHLTDHLNQGLLPESQCGFRKKRGTIDMIFAARQLQEKC